MTYTSRKDENGQWCRRRDIMKGYIQLSMTQILSTYFKLTGKRVLRILLGCTMYSPINMSDKDEHMLGDQKQN